MLRLPAAPLEQRKTRSQAPARTMPLATNHVKMEAAPTSQSMRRHHASSSHATSSVWGPRPEVALPMLAAAARKP